MNSIKMPEGEVKMRSKKMAQDVTEGKKKKHIIECHSIRWDLIRDLKLNRYRELLDHPYLSMIFKK